MKNKIFLSLLALMMIQTAYAKKVKFAVDMSTHTISPLGIHVMGDFQVAAGYSLNFDPGSTQLSQEGVTTIYSIVLDLPAFQKYEFKFVNGDQGYESEFVPDEARVGYNLNDNRWMFVDSLANDTSFLGAVKFGENSPAGKTLIRFVVDMAETSVSTNGVHVGGAFQGMNPATHRLVNLESTWYEIIAYVNTGSHTFKYYNGNTAGAAETVPNGCATAGTRTFNLTQDTIIPTVCFSSCSTCTISGTKENPTRYNSLRLFPNPAADVVYLSTNDIKTIHKIILTDISGKIAGEITPEIRDDGQVLIDLKNYRSGVYQLYVKSGNVYYHGRLVVR